MSRISNLTTIKIGLLRSWNSYWFDSYYYSYLLLGDLRIKDYITGVFNSLNIITDYLYIYRFVSDSIIIKTSLILLDYIGYKSIYVDGLHKLSDNFKFFYNKKTWEIFLTNLKIIGRIIYNGNYYKITNFYSQFLNYFRINYILSYFLNHKVNASSGHITYLNSQYVFESNNNEDSLLLDSFNLFMNKQCLDVLMINHSNIKYFNDYTILNLTKHFYNLGLDYSAFYYIFSYRYYINDSKLVDISKNNISNYRLVQLVRYLKNLDYFLSFLIINFLIVLKYAIVISDYLANVNILNISSIIVKILDYNFIIGNFYIRELDCQSLYIYNIRENITKSVINSLRFNIERSLYLFENKNIYFYFSLFIKRIPFFISAKIITDFLVYMFESGNRIVKSFYYIRNLQRRFYRQRRKLEYLFHSKKSEFQDKKKYTKEQAVNAINFYKYVYQLAMKRFPLIGMRIECSGSFKKGKMARTYHYTSWNRDYRLTGSMPNNTLISDIDYYQYYTILNSSTIGIKTWIFLETYLYNSNNMYIGIVY